MSKSPSDPTGAAGPDAALGERVARLEQALAAALSRSEAAEALVKDQQQRLNALGSGREETMRALADVRDELRLIRLERDELRKQLARLDSVQTATIALPDNEPAPATSAIELPSLDELMAALGTIQSSGDVGDGILHQRVQRERDDDGSREGSEEMLSPALVFPERYAATDAAGGTEALRNPRMLVLLDAERPIKYPLYKETLTIGRADSADIQIDNHFLSRLHARVVSTPAGVVIEDIESKNGIRVNAKLTPRQTLRHGDVVDLGRLRFRFIDAAAADDD
jgi:hypothetical protein